jgi:hypothetical protein
LLSERVEGLGEQLAGAAVAGQQENGSRSRCTLPVNRRSASACRTTVLEQRQQ